jgi:hypothetical protein
MRFHLSTLCAAIVMGLLIYSIAAGMLVEKVQKLASIGVSTAGRSSLDPTWVFIAVSAIVWWLVEFGLALRRHLRRSKQGYCSCCGRPIDTTLTRCAACGTRIPTVLNRARGFDVLKRA